jgi:hypothetical protein
MRQLWKQAELASDVPSPYLFFNAATGERHLEEGMQVLVMVEICQSVPKNYQVRSQQRPRLNRDSELPCSPPRADEVENPLGRLST